MIILQLTCKERVALREIELFCWNHLPAPVQDAIEQPGKDGDGRLRRFKAVLQDKARQVEPSLNLREAATWKTVMREAA